MGERAVTIASIDSPIEQRNTNRGKPGAVLHFAVELNTRQQHILDSLPGYNSSVTVKKSDINMNDLSALTAKTGDEFAMFTNGGDRLVIRGDYRSVPISPEEAAEMNAKGFVWSGHTHPGTDFNCLQASGGDYDVLERFDQESSVIYNSKGDYAIFSKEGRT